MLPKFRFVVATRESHEGFFSNTATGKSLTLYNFPFVDLVLHTNNSRGLPFLYNQAIEQSRKDPAILVFMHDDVHLCDFYWADQMVHALTEFQIIGVAGNKRRAPKQPSWAFVDNGKGFVWDERENLSGVVGHGKGFPPAELSVFGPPCQEVKLLDGLMLIAHSDTLLQKGLRFDERFDFHFYDMDFCRAAELCGARMGTWPISVIHESGGNFSHSWQNKLAQYFEKWGG